MQHNRLFSYFLATIQVVTAFLIFCTGPLFARAPLLLATELFGLGFGIWSILTMKIGNFNITPDVMNDAKLVMRGPYRLIRHPMYLSLLLVTLALVLQSFSIVRLTFWIALLIDLLIKLMYEERLLVAVRQEYRPYMQTTKRLIPFVF